MKILTPITSRTELFFAAVLALTCHAALFGLMPMSRAAPPEVQLSAFRPAIRVTLIPSRPVVRERAVEPDREKMERVLREEAPAAVREPVAHADRTEKKSLKKRTPDRVRVKEALKRLKNLPMREDAVRPEERLLVKQDEVNNPNEALSRNAVLEKGCVIEYPRHAIDLGWEGRVVLSILVSEAGRPLQVKVSASSGHSYLDRSAVRQVMESFRFSPAMNGLEPAAGWVEQSINFSLVDASVSVENTL